MGVELSPAPCKCASFVHSCAILKRAGPLNYVKQGETPLSAEQAVHSMLIQDYSIPVHPLGGLLMFRPMPAHGCKPELLAWLFFFHEHGRHVGMMPRSSLKEGKYNQMVEKRTKTTQQQTKQNQPQPTGRDSTEGRSSLHPSAHKGAKTGCALTLRNAVSLQKHCPVACKARVKQVRPWTYPSMVHVPLC